MNAKTVGAVTHTHTHTLYVYKINKINIIKPKDVNFVLI